MLNKKQNCPISKKDRWGGMDSLVYTWVTGVDSVSNLLHPFTIFSDSFFSTRLRPGCFWRHSE